MHNWDHSWWEDFWDSQSFAAHADVRNERGEWQDYSGLNPASHRPPQSPGPIGHDPHKEVAQGTHRQVGAVLRRFTWANTWQQLAAVAVEVLGPESFGLGVGYGLARSAGQSVLSLFAMQKMFVLADVYDLLHGSKSGALRFSLLAVTPGLGTLYGAALFLSRFELFGFGLPELEEAHRQRQALLAELAAIFRDPPAFFARLGTTIKQETINRWKRYQQLMKESGLRAQFEAGEILGELLFEIAILLLTVLDGVGVAIKLAKEAPELLRVLRTLSAASRESELAGGGMGVGRNAAQLEQEAGLAQKAPKPVSPGPPAPPSARTQPQTLPAPRKDLPPATQRQVEKLPGHGHGRHGSQTTIQQQEIRVQTGVAANGDVTKRPPTSTKFDSPEAELDAVQRAQARTAQRVANGQKSTAIEVAPDGTAKLPRDVSTVTGYPGGYGSGVTVIKDPVTGKPLPGRPVQPTGQLQNATVILEYNPKTSLWEPVTQFPSNDPVSP